MIAISATRSISKPIEMHECGKLCTKFKVPSTGSMIHVGASVNSHFTPSLVDSSPIKLKKTFLNYWFHRIRSGKLVKLTDDEEMLISACWWGVFLLLDQFPWLNQCRSIFVGPSYFSKNDSQLTEIRKSSNYWFVERKHFKKILTWPAFSTTADTTSK